MSLIESESFDNYHYDYDDDEANESAFVVDIATLEKKRKFVCSITTQR